MTAIAYRDGIMAADSVGWTCGDSVKVAVAPKIKRMKDGGIFAAAGETSEIDRLTHWMLGPHDSIPSFDKEGDLTVLWAKSDGTLWMCGHSLNFFRVVAPFLAIGAPSTFMMGALHAGVSAEEAVNLAVLHTDGAGGTIQVERLWEA